MRVVFVVGLCLVAVAYCQILRPGNTPEESGAPIYEEITVESVLTVRSKSGSRTAKSSSDLSKQNASETTDGVNVSRRTRNTEFSLQNPSSVNYASDVQSGYRIRRGIHPKISQKFFVYLTPGQLSEGLNGNQDLCC